MPPAFLRRVLTLLLPGLLAAGAAQAQLAVETLKMEPLQPADAHRIYLSDPTITHLVDGRIHVIDGAGMRYLGMVGSGFAGSSTLSPDRKTLYVATTYLSRLQRGTRTDVVEAYDTGDLTLRYEIEIPAKHAQSLPVKALAAVIGDGRFLLVQNATPATSVTVVDLQERRVASELANPGCWGAIPWPSNPHRFTTVCGDGTLATFELGPDGKAAQEPMVSKPFFDPDKDPIFMHYELVGDELVMVSYHGAVYTVRRPGASSTRRPASSAGPRAATPCSPPTRTRAGSTSACTTSRRRARTRHRPRRSGCSTWPLASAWRAFPATWRCRWP